MNKYYYDKDKDFEKDLHKYLPLYIKENFTKDFAEVLNNKVFYNKGLNSFLFKRKPLYEWLTFEKHITALPYYLFNNIIKAISINHKTPVICLDEKGELTQKYIILTYISKLRFSEEELIGLDYE